MLFAVVVAVVVAGVVSGASVVASTPCAEVEERHPSEEASPLLSQTDPEVERKIMVQSSAVSLSLDTLRGRHNQGVVLMLFYPNPAHLERVQSRASSRE